jgi:hypothetical protein
MVDYFHSDISSGFDPPPNLIDGVVVLGSPFPNPQDVQTNIDRSFINYCMGNNNNFYSMQYATDNITQYCGRMQRSTHRADTHCTRTFAIVFCKCLYEFIKKEGLECWG